jgi:nitroimidazol reductase NimA-like FMN-containing flavoprotein (pyridoxamine 5'-phosphate oxidase superfamily)
MRRSEREVRDRAVVDGIIRRAQVCRLGLIDGATPYIVPLCFGYDGQALYFHSAQQGRKMDLLRRHPQVCFEFDLCDGLVRETDACACSLRYESAMGVGTAEILEDPAAKRRGLALVMAQYGAPEVTAASFPEAAVARTAVVRVAIESITGKMWSRR